MTEHGAYETDEAVDLEPDAEDMLVDAAVEAVHEDLVECGLVPCPAKQPLMWDMLDVWDEWPENLAA